MRIKDTPKIDRPQEKMVKYGTKKLCNAELLAIILRTGNKEINVLQLSQKILNKFEYDFKNITIEKLIKISGLGETKACQIIAAIELGERLTQKRQSEYFSPNEIFNSLSNIRNSKKEHLLAIYLDTANREIGRETISIGTLNANLIHPRELFEPAVKNISAGIIIVHNHPSGDSLPSEEDISITKKLICAGDILGIPIFDHIIITSKEYYSFYENDLISKL